MSFHVVATDGLDKEAQETLRADSGVKLTVRDATPVTELVATLADADIAIIRSATVLNETALAQLPNLKGVLRAGVGIDNIDLNAAEKLGIWVWNAPTGNFQATAELALGLIFAAARRIPFATEGARQGKWVKKEIGTTGRQLQDSTLGVFGAGNIGLRVAKMAAGIGMKIQICDPVFKASGDANFSVVDFDTLLKTSDFITIHSPVLESTKHKFNLEAFSKMKPSSFIVNAARGGIIKDADLVTALEKNLIAGAALDVFEIEPFPADDAVYSKLLKDPRVVITPHVGASTKESQRLVGLETAEKILAVKNSAQKSSTAPKALNAPFKARLALSF